MENEQLDFEPIVREEKPPVRYKKITCHLIFYVKMYLNPKARYMAGGHLTDTTSPMK